MKRHISHLSPQTEAAEEVRAEKPTTEFHSVEEMLRHDAAQVAPPSRLIERLEKAAPPAPKRKRSWFRWFGS